MNRQRHSRKIMKRSSGKLVKMDGVENLIMTWVMRCHPRIVVERAYVNKKDLHTQVTVLKPLLGFSTTLL